MFTIESGFFSYNIKLLCLDITVFIFLFIFFSFMISIFIKNNIVKNKHWNVLKISNRNRTGINEEKGKGNSKKSMSFYYEISPCRAKCNENIFLHGWFKIISSIFLTFLWSFKNDLQRKSFSLLKGFSNHDSQTIVHTNSLYTIL